MALTENGNGIVMPVAPMNGYGNGGFGNFGGDWGWIILLLLFAGGGFGGFGGFGGGEIYPWMNQADITTSGFQNLATQNQISSISSGIGDLQTQLCSGFAGVNASIANGFAQAEIGENARQMANMQTAFNLQSQLAECCCENRLATNDLKYTIANEACQTRQNCSQNSQAILDKLCQLEIDGLRSQIDSKNDRIVDLQNQLNIATFNASQTAQNNYLQNALTAQTQYIMGVYPPTVTTTPATRV